MATGKSGSFELTTSGFAAKISWSETYSTSNNTSVVQIDSLQIKSSSWYSSYYLDGYISINGSKAITFNSALGSHSAYCSSLNTYFKVEACSSSYTNAPWSSSSITHNSDGTKSVPIAIDIKGYTTSGGAGSGWHISGSKNITLTAIPIASVIDSVSCSTSYFDGTLTYKYTPKSASYYNLCNISLNIDGEYIAIRSSIKHGKNTTSQQTAPTITFTDDELTIIYNNLPSTTKGILRFTFRTYSDSAYSKQVGSATYKEISLTIPTSVKPSIESIELNPVNITTVDGTSRNILVQGKNKLQIIPSSCIAGTGSKISSYTFSGPGITTTTKSSSNTSYEFNCGPISKTGSLTYTVKVTDKRGRSATLSNTITCYVYDAPSFSSFEAYRCDSSGTENDNGTYIKYSLKVNYSSIKNTSGNETNNSTVKIYYKKSTASSWTTAANALTSSTTKSTAAIIKNSSGTSITFDASATYLVYATVTDNYNGSVSSSTITIFGSSRVFNIRPNGTGMAFGKMAESDNLFESKWPAKFDDKLNVVGAVTIPDDGGPIINGYSVGTLGPGLLIQSGDDLNNYITAGVFRSTGETISETLINTPHTGSGFKLVVEYLGNATYLRQVIIPRWTSCKYYIRYYGNGTWYDWQTFSADDTTAYLPLSGGTLTGKLTLDTNLYYASGNTAGLDCKNSDIINANAIYFADVSNSAGEAINFVRSTDDGTWDTLYAYGGSLKFHPNRSTSTELGGYKVSHAGLTYTSLYSGTLTTGSTTFNYGNYRAYIVVGQTTSSGSRLVLYIPKNVIGTTDTQYQFADESHYYSFKLKYSGTTTTLSHHQRSSTGQILYVYGVD